MKFRRGRQRGVLVEGLESRVLLSTAHDAGVTEHVIFRTRPGNQSVGSKFGFTVAVVDSNGVTVKDNSNVTLTFVGPAGALINGTKKVALHNGTGTFSGLSLTGAGVYKIRVSESSNVTTNSPLVVGVSGLVISPPTSGGWQSAGSLTLGDPVQQVTSNGTVTGTFLGMNGGNITIQMLGTGTFDSSNVITDTATGGTLTPRFLTAGAVGTGSQDVASLPTASWALSSGVFTVGDTVQETVTTTSGTPVATGIFLGTVNGNYTFEVLTGRFVSPGTVTDTNSNATLKATSSNVTSTSTVTVSTLPAATAFVSGTAGAKTNVVVQVLGANGTVSTNDHSKISLVVAAGSGAGSTLRTVTAVNGVATFSNVTLTRAGVFSLKGVSGNQSSLPTGAITINPGPAVKLNIVSTFPKDTALPRPSGSLGPIVVAILDSFGNVVTAPSTLTLAPSTTRGWTVSGVLTANDRLVQVTTSNGTTTSSAGIFLGKDGSGNFLVRSTSGAFNNSTVITDTATGATLTPNSAAAFPSNDSTVTATVNTTLGTSTIPGKVTQAANGTATSVNGVANITLTSTAGTTGTLLGLKPGYYTLIVSDGALIGEQFQVHVG